MTDKRKIAVAGGLVAGVSALIYYATRPKDMLPPAPPPGIANLYGRITDKITGNGISGVGVVVNEIDHAAESGAISIKDGYYVFGAEYGILPGKCLITFTLGGQSISVNKTLMAGNNELNVKMEQGIIPTGVGTVIGKNNCSRDIRIELMLFEPPDLWIGVGGALVKAGDNYQMQIPSGLRYRMIARIYWTPAYYTPSGAYLLLVKGGETRIIDWYEKNTFAWDVWAVRPVPDPVLPGWSWQ